jgi:cytochrome c5
VGQIKKLLGILVIGGLLTASGFAFSQSSQLTAELKERLAPVGTLCKAGESCAAAPVAVSSGPRSAKEVYDGSCTTCHGLGVAGAPKIGDAADWGNRLNQGIETLYTHAIQGINAMPPMGLCTTCSEDEIRAAVDYMLENSK